MSKKLLSVNFYSVGGTHSYNLGCNSIGAVSIINTWQVSDNHPLNQSGCMFTMPNSIAVTIAEYVALHDAITRAKGYGPRNIFPSSINVIGLKMYINGDIKGSYVQYDYNIYGKPILNYYRADNTSLGPVINALGSMGNNYAGWASGQLYDDGTFIGCAGPIRAHEVLGVYSHVLYEWQCSNVYNDPIQAVNPAIIADIKEYLPTEPEGNYVDEGVGDFDATSDDVDFPDLPSLDAISSGMVHMYEMTNAQLTSLSDYLWSGAFDIDTFKKLFSNPMEAILNLAIMPVDVSTEYTANIKIGNITTTVEGQICNTQYKIIDFGKINLHEFWGNFADYSPYTKISIFLPYVGVQTISIDDVMNGTIQLKAYCDVLTGSVQYVLLSNQVNRSGHGHNSVLYTWGGNCQYQIPISSNNMAGILSSIISMAGTITSAVGATVATGGMSAPLAVGTIGGTISNVMNSKTHVQRGGGIGGAIGIFGVQTPYLILERPEQITAENYNNTIGVPNEKTSILKYYSGFVKVRGVNLNITTATENEKSIIENMLKAGVLI